MSSAHAFVPPTVDVAPLTVNQAKIDEMYGATVESAGLFDPWGLGQQEDQLYRRRCVEIKHGRVAMLAATGFLAQECFKFPGYIAPSAGLKFADMPASPMAALSAVPIVGWVQIVFFIGVLETTILKQDPSKAPGDIAPAGWKRYDDPEEKAEKLMIELRNGRLAMWGVLGMMAGNIITGEGPIAMMLDGSVYPFKGAPLLG